MADIQTRRDFNAALGTLLTSAFFGASSARNEALGNDRGSSPNHPVSAEILQRTLHASCQVLVPTELGSLPGERSAANRGTGALLHSPKELADLVGPDRMVIVTAAHTFTDNPPDTVVTVNFFSGDDKGVAVTETMSARILSSDRFFQRTDDIAFLVIDIPKDPVRAERLRQRALPLDTSQEWQQFSFVASVGFPGDTCTMVNNLRLLDTPAQRSGNTSLLLTGLAERGHSGGPLVNAEGKLIGVVSGAHPVARTIAQGEALDFRPSWELLTPRGRTTAENLRAIRQHDLRHIPQDVQVASARIVGPTSTAIGTFMEVIRETYSNASAKTNEMLEQSQGSVRRLRSSNLSVQDQEVFATSLRNRISSIAAELFAPIGGTPKAVTDRIQRLSETPVTNDVR